MRSSLSLSPVGRLSLGLAILLALLAAGVLAAVRANGDQRGAAGAATLPGLASGVAFAQGANFAPGQQSDPTGLAATGITTVGDGEASAQPDVAFLTLGVQADGKTAREALDKASAAMNTVLDTLKRLGVADKDLRTTGLSVTPVRGRQQPGDTTPPPVVGYQASNNINVTVRALSRAGEYIDAAVDAGANVAGGIRFAIDDTTGLRKQSLELASRDARNKADSIAAGLGLRISSVRAASEESLSVPVARSEAFGVAAADKAAPVEPGELTVRARVRVVFNIG